MVRCKLIFFFLCLLLSFSAFMPACGGGGGDEGSPGRETDDDEDDPWVPDDDDEDDDLNDDIDDDQDDDVDDDQDDDINDDVDDDVDDDIDDDIDDDATDDDTEAPIPAGMIVDEGVEGYTDLALDSLGRPFVVYKALLGGLKYAQWTGDEWLMETADSSGIFAGMYAAITLGDGDTPLVAYYNGGLQKTLKFAERTDKGWDAATVDDSADVGAWCDIAVDGEGVIHISYQDITNGDLKVARYFEDSWETEVVEDGEETGLHTSIAFDSGNTGYIAYYDAAARSLKVARGTFGSWTIDVVDEAVEEEDDRGRWTSTAVDGADRAHVAYQDAALLDLKYALYEASSWTVETVDGIGNKGADACLMLTGDNLPRIVYQDGSDLSIRYAKLIDDDWQFQVLMDGQYFTGSFGFWMGCGLRYSGPVVSHYYTLDDWLLIYPAFD